MLFHSIALALFIILGQQNLSALISILYSGDEKLSSNETELLKDILIALKDLIRINALLYLESVGLRVAVAGDLAIKHKLPVEKAEKLLPKLEVIERVAEIAKKHMSERERAEYGKQIEILKKDAIDFKGYIFSL